MAATQQQKTPDIRIRREIITPEKAEALLANNSINRILRTKRANELAVAIKSGHWQFNGSSIVVLESGKIGDGQHRLAGVIISGVSIETTVTYGVPDSAFSTIDTGSSRSARDLAGLAGYSNANISTAAAGVVWRIITGAAYNETSSPKLILTVLDRYQTISYWSSKYQGASTLRTIIPGACFVAACVYLDEIACRPDLAHDFYEKMSTGLNILDGDPIGSLRNRLVSDAQTRAQKGTRRAWPLTVRCLNLIESGEKAPRRFNVLSNMVMSAPVPPDRMEKHLLGMTPELRFEDFPANTQGGNMSDALIKKLGATKVPSHARSRAKKSRAA